MTCTDVFGILFGKFNQRLIGAAPTDQTLAGGLAKGKPEFDAGDTADQGLVDIFYGFNEMRLTQDKIHRFWFLDPNILDLQDAHSSLY
jgi:hypothetical protein